MGRTCIFRHLAMTHHHQHHHQLPAITLSIQPVLPAHLPVRNYSSVVNQLPPIVSYEEVVKALADSSAVVIDVRQAEELERDGSIPGALHIPLADLETALAFRPKKFERIFKVSIDESTLLCSPAWQGSGAGRRRGLPACWDSPTRGTSKGVGWNGQRKPNSVEVMGIYIYKC